MHAGYYEEAQAWREWLLRAVAGSPEQLQIMYGIGGERRLIEWEVPTGCPATSSRAPVRIGNAAHTQLQLDVFGETHGRRLPGAALRASTARIAAGTSSWHLLEHLAEIWREPDEGIWEVRGPAQHFTYSKVMAWVAFDRAHQERRDVRARRAARRLAQAARRDSRRCLRARLRQEAGKLRAGLWLEAARRQSAAAALHRLSAGRRSAHRAAPSRRSSAHLAARRLRHALQHRCRSTMRCRPAKARSSPAASGWSTSICCRAATTTPSGCFDRLVGLCNDVGLLSEEYDPRARSASSAISRRRSRIWR